MKKLHIPEREDCELFVENHRYATCEQARAYFNLSRSSLMRAAEEVGAIRRFGRSVRIDLAVMNQAYGG